MKTKFVKGLILKKRAEWGGARLPIRSFFRSAPPNGNFDPIKLKFMKIPYNENLILLKNRVFVFLSLKSISV